MIRPRVDVSTRMFVMCAVLSLTGNARKIRVYVDDAPLSKGYNGMCALVKWLRTRMMHPYQMGSMRTVRSCAIAAVRDDAPLWNGCGCRRCAPVEWLRLVMYERLRHFISSVIRLRCLTRSFDCETGRKKW